MHAGNGLGNLALSPRINILAVVRSENTRPCSYSYHLDFTDDIMASQAEVSLVNKHLHVSGTYRKWGRGPDSHLRFHKSGWELTVLRLL